MTLSRKARTFCIISVVFCLTGCGSMVNFFGPVTLKAFGGIEYTVEQIQRGRTYLWWLDLPLTIVVDVATLPISAVLELIDRAGR